MEQNNYVKNSTLGAVLAIAACYIMGGFDFLVIEYITNQISPITMIFLRFFLSGIALLLIVLLKEKRFYIASKDRLRIFLGGAVGIALYFTLESIGIQRTSGALASLIMATVPIFGLIGDRVVNGSKITMGKSLGILFSIIGVALIVLGSGDKISGSIAGILFMFAAAICWVLYIIIIKPLQGKYSLLTVTTGLFMSAAVVSTILFLVSQPIRIPNLDGKAWTILILSTIIAIIIGQLLYIYGIGRVSVTTAAIYANLLPIFSVLFSYLLFKTALGLIQIIGGVIILISVTMISINNPDQPA